MKTTSLFIGFTLVLSFCAPCFAQTAPVITPSEMQTSRQNHLRTLRLLDDPSLIKSLSSTEIRSVIANAVSWIKNAQEPNGHFCYEYYPYRGVCNGKFDNIVRQAGTLYELGEIIRLDTQNKFALDKVIENAISYLQSLSKPSAYNGKTFSCIVDAHQGGDCKVGATALAVIGVISYVEARPVVKETYAPLIERYMAFVRAMRKKDAGFSNVFDPLKGTTDGKESPYGNGEAFLALVRYAKYTGYTAPATTEIESAYPYISRLSPDPALYLWFMAALKDLDSRKPQKAYADLAKTHTDARMAPFDEKQRHNDHNLCSYVEGITSAYPVLRKHLPSETAHPYRKEIDFWLAKSALLQVSSVNLVQSDLLGKEGFKKTPQPDRAIGGFLTGHYDPAQRIDFTQHCVSSYIQTLADIDGLHF